MNWDISIGRLRQVGGRLMQAMGQRFAQRKWVLDGEAMEYAGRLQIRYGMLKHQVQWGPDRARMSDPIAIRTERSLHPAKKPMSL